MWSTRPQSQRFGNHPCVIVEDTHKALAAYESAKKGEPQMFTPCKPCECPFVCSDLGNCYAAKGEQP